MKRGLLVAATLIFMSGCSSIPMNSATTIPSGSSVPTGSEAVWTTALPMPMPTATPVQTASTSQTDGVLTITDTIPPLTGEDPGPGLKIGTIVISKDDLIYYVEDESYDVNDELVTRNVIYQLHKGSDTPVKIRQIDKQQITRLFLDEQNRLYYVSWEYVENNYIYRLYLVNKSEDVQIANNVGDVIRIDKQYLYYYTDSGSIHKYNIETKTSSEIASFPAEKAMGTLSCGSFLIQQIIDEYGNRIYYAIDLTTRIVYNIFGNNATFLFEDNQFQITYTTVESMTYLKIYDFYARRIKASTLPIILNTECIYLVFQLNSYLYVVDYDNDRNKSTIYEFDTESSKLIQTKELPFWIESEQFYDGKCYFYTANWPEPDPDSQYYQPINQAIQEMNPETLEFKPVLKIEKSLPEGFSRTFVVEGGYIWLIDWAYNVDSSYCWKRVKIE